MELPLSIYNQRITSGQLFRLLFILPSANEQDPLQCYCLPFDLDEAPTYEALSYVWGCQTPPENIQCNGQNILIGPQLGYALTRLRQKSSTRIVWADALCINQADDQEKSHQVPLMGRIYSSAKRVVVSLGFDSEELIEETSKCVRSIAEACRQYERQMSVPAHERPDRWKHLEIAADAFSPNALIGLKTLYENRWFTRVWCIQEIRLAQDAIFLWGQQQLSFHDVSLAAGWIFDRTSLPDGDDDIIRSFNQIFIATADMLFDVKNEPMLQVLKMYREFEATDPRDKVYGLLNLMSNGDEIEALELDYRKSVGEVFADTVLCEIHLHSKLTTLAYVTHKWDYDGNHTDHNTYIPSWAPRWDDLEVAMLFAIGEDDWPQSACANRPVRLSNTPRTGFEQLNLVGVLYKYVQEVDDILDFDILDDFFHPDGRRLEYRTVAPDQDNSSTVSGDDEQDMHPFVALFQKVLARYGKGRRPEAVILFSLTLTAGAFGARPSDRLKIPILDEETLLTHVNACILMILNLEKRMIAQKNNYALYSDIDINNNDDDDGDSIGKMFQDIAYDTCKQRRIFWTSATEFGLGPHSMRSGDVVVVLYGGKTPYVLRPRGDKYIFMGEAYLDDIMTGKLVEEVETGRRQEQEFCLI